jgi:beta-lactamase class D
MAAHVSRRFIWTAVATIAVTGAARRFAGAGAPLVRAEWNDLFAKAGTTGVICVAPKDAFVVSDAVQCQVGKIPASTFKIANALIALETGVVSSAEEWFEWDGTERGINGKPIAAWNKSQTLREAFANSAVWVYQDVARRIGSDRMRHFVSAFDYGNRDISGAPVDAFWLTGNLRISPLQQIAFLQRLWAGRLPVAAQHVATVQDMMVIERLGGVTLHGKTGWQGDVGWFVGLLVKGQDVTPFALTMTLDGSTEMAKARISIVKQAARDLGILS